MKKKMTILCSSLVLAGLCAVATCSSNAVEAPDVTRIETTTCVEPTTLYTTRMTTTPMTTKCTTSCTTTTPVTTKTCVATTTMLTTISEVSTKVTEIETISETTVPVTKTIASEITVTEYPVTEAAEIVIPETIVELTEPMAIEYVVYKPSTKYIHRSTCRWNSGDAYRIDNTEGIEARRCTECSPDIEIVNEYIEPVPEPTYISDSDKYYLAVMLSRECSPRASVEHNATAVACMFNRVRDGWASSIYDAIQTGCVPWWSGGSLSSYGLYGDTDYCYAAIDYYLNHSDEYTWQHSWYASGNGITNYFY